MVDWISWRPTSNLLFWKVNLYKNLRLLCAVEAEDLYWVCGKSALQYEKLCGRMLSFCLTDAAQIPVGSS